MEDAMPQPYSAVDLAPGSGGFANEPEHPRMPWCMDQGRGRNNPNPVRGQAMRT